MHLKGLILLLVFLQFVAPRPAHADGDADSLPARVELKTTTESFTQQYEAAVRGGRLWYRKRGETDESAWQELGQNGLPSAKGPLEGFKAPSSIKEVSADGDNLIALGDDDVVYYMKWLNFEWTRLWGKQLLPFRPDRYLGAVMKLPDDRCAWAISHRGPFSKGYEDIDGNKHPISAGVTTLYLLSHDGLHLYYADPWLPPNFHRELAMPERGRFRALAMSASASTLFVMDQNGESYTRLADYDTTGNDPALKYTYRHGKRGPDGARTLPGEDWRPQPALPPGSRVTGRITIMQTGEWNAGRELRIEGVSADGVPGYFSKPIFGDFWAFTGDRRSIAESALLKPVADPMLLRGPVLDRNYAGSIKHRKLLGRDAFSNIEVLGLNSVDDSARVRLQLRGKWFELPLYVRRTHWDVSGPASKLKGVLVIPDELRTAENKDSLDELGRLFGKTQDIPIKLELKDGRVEIFCSCPLPKRLGVLPLAGSQP